MTFTGPKKVQMGCNVAKLVGMGIGSVHKSDRTALDDVTVQACAMG